MTGSVAIVSVFVSDSMNKWDKASVDEYMQVLKKAVDFIMTNGGRETGLVIPLTLFYACDIDYLASIDCNYNTCRSKQKTLRNDVLHKLGYQSVCDLRSDVMKNNPNITSVAVLFVLNESARSFAMCTSGRKSAISTRRAFVDSGEYAFIFFRSHSHIVYTLCHEIFHLYGAIDYYYPSAVKMEAERHFPNSIMLGYRDKPIIDDLTRFLLGWKNSLSTDSLAFLSGTLCTRRRDIN